MYNSLQRSENKTKYKLKKQVQFSAFFKLTFCFIFIYKLIN